MGANFNPFLFVWDRRFFSHELLIPPPPHSVTPFLVQTIKQLPPASVTRASFVKRSVIHEPPSPNAILWSAPSHPNLGRGGHPVAQFGTTPSSSPPPPPSLRFQAPRVCGPSTPPPATWPPRRSPPPPPMFRFPRPPPPPSRVRSVSFFGNQIISIFALC